MKKEVKLSKKELAKRRANAKNEIIVNFSKAINNAVVLSPELKIHIIDTFVKSVNRISELCDSSGSIPMDKWSSTDTWKEYKELEKELKMSSIFSDSFFSMLYNHFYLIGHVMNPYTTF